MVGSGPRDRGGGGGGGSSSSTSVGEGAAAVSGGGANQGPMQQFFTKLRRHASLEGASPYFKIKKWKLDSSQRASSLDTRGDRRLMVVIFFSTKDQRNRVQGVPLSLLLIMFSRCKNRAHFPLLDVGVLHVLVIFSQGKQTSVKQGGSSSPL